MFRIFRQKVGRRKYSFKLSGRSKFRTYRKYWRKSR